MKEQRMGLCCDERASISFCQINVALLRGPLVDYLLADAWMGQPPAPNDPSDVRYWHKIAWKWWFGALKFQSFSTKTLLLSCGLFFTGYEDWLIVRKLYFWGIQRFISWLEISKSLSLNSIPQKCSFGLQANLISWLHCALMAPLRPQSPYLSFTSNLKLSNVVLFCLAPSAIQL